MADRARRMALLLGGTLALVALAQLWSLWSFPRDIWWTGVDRALRVEEARDRVQVRVRGELLEDALRAGRLVMGGAGGQAPLGPGDVTVRLDNRDRELARRLPSWLVAAATFGAGATMVGFAVTGLSRRARARDAAAPR
jgi:hypothetical protein